MHSTADTARVCVSDCDSNNDVQCNYCIFVHCHNFMVQKAVILIATCGDSWALIPRCGLKHFSELKSRVYSTTIIGSDTYTAGAAIPDYSTVQCRAAINSKCCQDFEIKIKNDILFQVTFSKPCNIYINKNSLR